MAPPPRILSSAAGAASRRTGVPWCRATPGQGRRRRSATLTILLAPLSLLPLSLAAEDRDFLSLGDPNLATWTVRAGAGVERERPVEAANSQEDYSRTTYQAGLAGVVWQNKESELQLNALERKSYLTTDAVFPSGLPLPDVLQEARAGFLARHLLGGGWVAGLSASLGSWDEQPFTSTAHPIISAGAFVRMPASGDDAWIFSLSYSNERSALNGVPIPGAEYSWTVSPTLHIMLGFPMVNVNWRPLPGTRCEFLFSGFGYVHAGGSFPPLPFFTPWRLRAAVDFGGDRYQREDPADQRDLIFFRALTYSVGSELRQEGLGGIGIALGYETNREIIEGHSLFDTSNHIDVNNGWVLRASADLRY
jgi:hypothetical protein